MILKLDLFTMTPGETQNDSSMILSGNSKKGQNPYNQSSLPFTGGIRPSRKA